MLQKPIYKIKIEDILPTELLNNMDSIIRKSKCNSYFGKEFG